MQRRTVLTGLLGVCLAGCSGSRTEAATPSAAASASASRSSPSSSPSSPSSPSSSSGSNLRWSVEPLSAADSDRPARVRITLANVGSSTDLTAAGALPFPPTPGEPIEGGGDGPTPVLLPVGSDYERRYNGRCWVSPLDDPEIADDAPWAWGYGEERTVALAGGERIRGSYELVNGWTADCFEAGTYRFERRYELDGKPRERAIELRLPVDPER